MSRLTLIVGTGNAHKLREISQILSPVPNIRILPFTDFEPMPEIDEDGRTFAENAAKKAHLLAQYLFARRGVTASGRHTAVGMDSASAERLSAARAREQARGALGLNYEGRQGYDGSRRILNSDSTRLNLSDAIVLADDSGIEVDALGGAPGVLSARYAGRHGDDAANNALLLKNMEKIADGKRNARFVCALALATQRGALLTVEGKVEGTITHELRGTNGFGYDPLFFYPPYKATFGEVDAEAKNAVSHRANALKQFKSQLMRLLTDEGLA